MGLKPKIVVVTGAESTGKSELTQWLSNKYKAPYVPEYARNYIEKLQRKYNYEDVEIIAKKQIEQLNILKKSEVSLIFVDTWLIIIKVWFEVVFRKVPEWVEQELVKTNIDLFLVCNTDLSWKPDLVRENGGKSRILLHNRYIKEIEKYSFDYKIVEGFNRERFSNASKILNQSGIL